MKSGKVYLVGAGSGDPELLTLKGKRVLEIADVIIYDRLVHPVFLYLAKKEATFIYCGKLPHAHTLTQKDIQERMVHYAKKGKIVVRLKGGDPAIFGRVGEEMQELANQSIPYEVVPGTTAASAASIYAGIPLTHRKYSGQVTFATAHRQFTQEQSIEFATLINGGTLAFYMGVENLPLICEKLLINNVPQDTPIALIEWGTYGRQRSISGTIRNIVKQMTEQQFKNPSLIIIGSVVSLKNETTWFEDLPQFGKNILLVSSKQLTLEKVTSYTAQGADIWGIQVGNAVDSRFDETHIRYLSEQNFEEVIYLEENIEPLLKKELVRLNTIGELKLNIKGLN